MGSDISLTKAVRANLMSLQNTASLMGKTQERLATGNKVNSALDNPTNFFTASSLNARAGDMATLLDGMANGVKTLEAADKGLTAITKNLEQMQSTLRQARQDKSFLTSSFTMDSTAKGNLSFTGGALGEANVDAALEKSVFKGNGGFAGPNNTAQSGGTLSFKAGAKVNGGAAVSVSYAVGDTAETVAQKINERVSKTLGGSTLHATVKNGQIELSNTTNDAITDVTGGQAIGLSTAAVGATALVKAAQTLPAVATGALSAGTVTVDGETINLAATGKAADAAAVPPVVASTVGENGSALAQQLNDAFAEKGMEQFSAASDAAGVITITRADGKNFVATGNAAGPIGVALPAGYTAGVPAVGAVAATAASSTAKTVDEMVQGINTNASLKENIRASNDNGKLRIENLSTQKLKITGASGGNITGLANATSSIEGNSVRAGLADQFNELRDQLDKLSDDASFNGINLLRGDNLRITFNETGTSSIDIRTKAGQAVNSGNLKVETTLTAEDLDNDDRIDAYLGQIKQAMNSVRSQASEFGSNLSIVQNRNEFTKNMINTLETGAANLTLADTNEEAANLLALQTRQQLSSSALSMASQQDQAVLQLLR